MGSQGSLPEKGDDANPPDYRGTRYQLVPWTLDKLAQAGMYSYKLQSGTTEA